MKIFNKELRFTIRLKLMAIISIVIILSLTALSVITIDLFSEKTSFLIQGLTNNSNRMLKGKIETELKTRVDTLILLDAMRRAGNSKVTDLLKKKMLSSSSKLFYVTAFKKSKNNLNQLQDIYSLENKNILRKAKLSKNKLKRKLKFLRKYFLSTFQNEILIKNISNKVGVASFVIVVPIQDSKKTASHIVVGVYSSSVLDKVFLDEKITSSYILDSMGDVVIHKNKELTEKVKSFREHPAYRLVQDAKVASGFSRKEIDGEEYFISYSGLAQYNLNIISVISSAIALETVSIVKTRSILISIVILLVAILLIYFFARSMSGPVKELVVATQEVKSGNYEYELQPKTKDEIGDLTKSFNSMATGLAEREKLKGALGKFVNAEIAEQALKGEITLGGERKQASVFFSDIRSFTAISENMQPEQVVEFLNEYMTLMVNIINDTGGVVDKFIGDAIMAVWGVPSSRGNDLENSINAALQMRKALIKFNANRGSKEKPIIKIGCGINYGPVLAGQIGSDDRLEYTVIGDVVNLASRIEGLNKPFGTDVLISEVSYKLVNETFHCLPTQRIRVKGKTEPQKVYVVLGRYDDDTRPKNINELRNLVGIVTPSVKDKNKNPSKKYETV